MAGMALDDIEAPVAWQAWHLVTSTLLLCGRRTCGTGLEQLIARQVFASHVWACVTFEQLFHIQLFKTIDPPPSRLPFPAFSIPLQSLFLIIGRS